MIIQHNIMALNSYNKLSGNNSAVQKNLEKLSSGYRINRAGDDAAGLAISEKMRAQITGLERAKLNAQDGISLVQTAEGALTEVHSMLNRLVELGVESANGIYQADDRQKIQDEVKQITEEIDRISDATNFNGIKLLDGSLGSSGGGKVAVNVNYDKLATYSDTLKLNAATKTTVTFEAIAAGTAGQEASFTVKYQDNNQNGNEVTVTYTAGSNAAASNANLMQALKDSALGSQFDFTLNAAGTDIEMKAKEAGQDGFKVFEVEHKDVSGATIAGAQVKAGQIAGADAYYTLKATALAGGAAFAGGATQKEEDFIFEINGEKFAFVDNTGAGAKAMEDKGVHYVKTAAANVGAADVTKMIDLINEKTGIGAVVNATTTSIDLKAGTKGVTSTNGLTLQIGDTSEEFNKVTVSVDNMSSRGLGIANLDVTEQGISSKSIDKVKSAIEKVSTNRGRLGALQNRLEHTINNLATTTENMTAAESRVRDTDMAKEMMNFTKNNVLVQAAQSMLAQANQQPQQVLQLLR